MLIKLQIYGGMLFSISRELSQEACVKVLAEDSLFFTAHRLLEEEISDLYLLYV